MNKSPGVELHAPRGFARVVVGVVFGDPATTIAPPGPLRRIIVIAMRAPQMPGVPPIVALDSRQHSRPGHALCLLWGQQVELAGEVPIFGSVRDAFAGAIDWGAHTEPAGHRAHVRIAHVTIDGHRLT